MCVCVCSAFNSRCAESNSVILTNLAALRRKKADLLGYASHADFVTEMSMAKNSETVAKFHLDLTLKMMNLTQTEKYHLREIRLTETGTDIAYDMESYDQSYYRTMAKQEKYGVDDEAVQQYFPMVHVKARLLWIYNQLFGLRFTLDNNQPKWHEEVDCYQVTDGQTLLGWIYMDMYPRDGKYGEAGVFTLQPGTAGQDMEGRVPAVCSMVCNFTRATATSLLTHAELVTFFHEFGHCMHVMCATVPQYGVFAGMRVESDFVDCPSQMFENWCWLEEPLRMLSQHCTTGEKMPLEMVKALINSRMANEGINNRGNLMLGRFDQTIHGRRFLEFVCLCS